MKSGLEFEQFQASSHLCKCRSEMLQGGGGWSYLRGLVDSARRVPDAKTLR